MVDYGINKFSYPIMTIQNPNFTSSKLNEDKEDFDTKVTNPIQYSNSNVISALDAQAIQNANLIKNVSDFNKNISIGKSILDNFHQTYPTITSSSILDVLAMHLQDINPKEAKKVQEMADSETDKYVDMSENRHISENFSNENYIDEIKKAIDKYNMANCGERAYLVQDKLNKMGIPNKIIQIDGEKNTESHVFNLIGTGEDFDVNNPGTWGENAVVIDTWSNRVTNTDQAINFYHDFMGYTRNNHKMNFKEINLDDIRKSTLEDIKSRYEQTHNCTISDEELGKMTYRDIFQAA